jgi:hypothetical protein
MNQFLINRKKKLKQQQKLKQQKRKINFIHKKNRLEVKHNAGFFSCCSVRLDNIIHFFNKNKKLPDIVDSSKQFEWYKPEYKKEQDITFDYFRKNPKNIKCINHIDYKHNHQYLVYKNININRIYPFIEKYFSLSDEIKQIENEIETKYNINYENTCVLFYRGNDKATETNLPEYSDYIRYGKKIEEIQPGITFLIQSDETQFIETMSSIFQNHIILDGYIRHMRKSKTTVDKIAPHQNYDFSKKYLAITHMMSKCKYVIFGSGNCSIWIVLYRGHTNGIIQHHNGIWYHTI